ncbi:MAG: peptidoglycan DD-metalloendopeptidase family protein [Alphaproteobacteria bacterium]|nr:peptidoglycan DD-metalloendopeptidase family protein [Alphaproteobacteria bacterium]MCB9930181.1 peptidoglycan DD-metalloendopeptidase family protein [Alphaproteobacteria bacterium]
MAPLLRLAALALALALAVGPARAAAPDPERAAAERHLEQAQQQLRAAEAAKTASAAAADAMRAEVAALQTAVQSAADDLRSHEQVIRQRAAELHALQRKQADTLAAWHARRAEVGTAISALTRLATVPPAATLLQGTDTTSRLRSAFVLRALVPRLQHRADRVRQDLADIRRAAKDVAAARIDLVQAKAGLERRLAEVQKLVRRKNAVLAVRQNEADLAIAAAHRQAKSADDVRELIARLDDARSARNAAMAAERARRAIIAQRAGTAPPPDPGPPLRLVGLESRRGGLLLPVTGSVTRRFGEGKDAFSEGISVSATPDAPVLAPADGRIRYAGEFQKYGLVLIIDHGGGFHSVLTGFSRLNVATDQWVLAGEPVGRVAAHGSLYIEIRRNGRPVDPLQWFTAGRS